MIRGDSVSTTQTLLQTQVPRPLSVGRRSAVVGTGSCLPARSVHNDDFPATLATNDEWIRTRTGIRCRRLTGPDENSYTLGLEAGRRAIAAAGLTANDIDLIVCATVTPYTMCPSNACRFQGELGCRPIPAFDVIGACTGFIHVMSIADQFIQSGTCNNVLVVGSDVLSRTLDYTDRSTCILFGDAAGAVVLSATGEQGRGVRWTRMYSDGARGDLIRMPSHVTNTIAVLSEGQAAAPVIPHLVLNGREVFRFAVRALVGLVQEALEACPVPEGARFLLVPHQVNQRIIDAALQELPLRPEQVVLNLDRYGNTSAASIPLALDEAVATGTVRSGDHLLMAAFGGGLTWGGIMLTL
ncbi:MAG: ketoacyl-ACP synthase III [Planctomycetia bacterium]|nr:ketoacyl-ACP synthase III [Planctomycetia bacterium]